MYSPKIVAFLCTWCSYAGADLAGTGRNQYPPNIRVIRIPCSGRINPIYIIKALLEGADGVLVSGCHPGDCHYLVGNYFARRRFVVLKKLLTTAGFDADRVQFTWVSASEGARFADVIKAVSEKVAAASREDGSSVLLSSSDVHDKAQARHRERPPVFPNAQKARQSNCPPVLHELISHCKSLLENGTVDAVVGFRAGGETGLSLPCIITSPEDADKLVWNDRCVPNLSGYLCDREGRTAIVAKPCDARAVVNLIAENQLKRENVYIIGMVCDGMTGDNAAPLPCCLECTVRIAPVCDVLIGNPDDVDGIPVQSRSEKDVHDAPLADFTSERFADEMSKCILCFSCRQSCYGCYCKTCFIDRGEPDWQTASPDTGAKMLYHLGRAMHLAGRCVECGACENACASGVDIRYLIRETTSFIHDTYEYRTGMDIETKPAMLTYKTDDSEIGFLE